MPGKLLIIDDEQGTTQISEFVAGEFGSEVRTVNDPQKATEVLLAFQPDMIIIDIDLLVPDIVGALKSILAAGQTPHVVLASAQGDALLRLADGVAKFHGVEAVSSLRKPYQRQDLVKLLGQTRAP